MPSIAAHTVVGLLVSNYLKINSDNYMIGNWLPDMINKNDSHYKVQGVKYLIPDIDHFIESNYLDDLNIGYLTHLYLDKLFLEEYVPNNIKQSNALNIFKKDLIYNDYSSINYKLLIDFNVDIVKMNSIFDLIDDKILDKVKLDSNKNSFNNNQINDTSLINYESFKQFLIDSSIIIYNNIKQKLGLFRKYVLIRDYEINYFINDKSIKIEKYDNDIIIIKAFKEINKKTLVDVTNNSFYLDENISKIKNKYIYLEGTDGVGKTTIIVNLINKGYFLYDRNKIISDYMLFNIDDITRNNVYYNYLANNNINIVFLVNNDKEELNRRIKSKEKISIFDKYSYEYNMLYTKCFNQLSYSYKLNNLQMIDLTGLSIDEQTKKIIELIGE